MEGKGFKVVTILLIAALIAGLGVAAFFIIQQNKEKEDLQTKITNLEESLKKQNDETQKLKYELNERNEEEEENSKNELVEDEQEENNKTELTETEKQEIVEAAFEQWLKERSKEERLELEDYKIENVKIVDVEELKETWGDDVLEFEDSIPAEVTFSVKPATEEPSDSDWVAGNGEITEEWIKNKGLVVEVALTTKGYKVINGGTGW